MKQEIYKSPTEQSESMSKNRFTHKGKKFWSGAANSLDGIIDEVHPYAHAKANDFHHSFYFSDGIANKIDNGESVFFYADDNGELQIDPIGRAKDAGVNIDSDMLKRKILEQIKKSY